MTDADGSGFEYAFAITLKPPTYTIDGGAASPASVNGGGTSTATVTVNPQPGYSGTISLSCSISPQIVGDPASAATAPTCSLSPTSVTVTTTETSPPSATMTFTASSAANSSFRRPSKMFYALWLPVPAVVLLGLGCRDGRRKKFFGWFLLGLLTAGIVMIPGCFSRTQLGNVGTPPGQYTVSITGLDGNGLTQASNSAGTSNTVVVTVAQ
jgi:hypothetical protein